MSVPAQAHAGTGASAPYKIRDVPKQLYFGGPQPQTYRSLTKSKYFDLQLVFTHQKKDIESFASWFDPPSRCIFEVYYKRVNNEIGSRGFLCLLCGEFSFNALQPSKEGLTKSLAHHISEKHHFLGRYYNFSPRERDDAKNLIYCDFLQYQDSIYDDDYVYIEKQINISACCYLCALCGERYAVTPSFDVIVSHIKKCEYVKDCINNNDLNRYKPPKRSNRAKHTKNTKQI